MVKAAHNPPANRQPYTVEYAYDHQGRRVAAATSTWTNDAWQAVESRAFIYDGWNIVQETVAIGNQQSAVTNSFVWGLDIAEQSGAGLPRHSAPGASAGGIGGLLAASLDGSAALYCYDANGNVGQLVGTSGDLLAHYEYSVFGETAVSTGPLAKANPLRFSTKHWDDLIGLGYWGYRWYSPGMGRWLTHDPIAEKGGINLYGAFGNSPLKGYDVLGLAVVTDGSCSSEMKEKLKDAFDKLKGAVADAKAMKCCLENAGFKGAVADNMINRMRGSGANVIVKCTDCLNKDSCGFVCNADGGLPSDQCKVPGIVSGTIYMCNGQFGSSKCPAHCTLLHELGHSVGKVPTETAPPASEKCLSGCTDSK